MINLGVLASGRGSNFQSIIDEIESGRLNASIKLLIVDNPNAFAIERAKAHSLKYIYIYPNGFGSKNEYFQKIVDELKANNVELVILAGFMQIVKKPLIDAFPNKIMNIHPTLLPSFKGLRGQKQALDYGVKISGCTVHFVDEAMDTGAIIIQSATPVYPDDTEESLSKRILKLEHKIYPEAIRLYAEGRLRVEGRIVRIINYKSNQKNPTNK